MNFFLTFFLLLISNIFMTMAWYGHLKYKDAPIYLVIVVAWLIAFVEYCFQVPANRIGHTVLTAPQLKALQEGITFTVFALFSSWYLREKPTSYDFAAFSLIMIGMCISLFQPRAGH
jgi:uncharacterized protein (DUF486 family)